ncbi:MAG: laccase domain-containing protein [Candidatus Rokubacteria bacterium]|nr:laccase domain-containing protein [Candidatus Rokubacteria bacterium]
MPHRSLVSHGDPPQYFTFRSLTAFGVPHATTTRHFDGTTSFAERGVPFRAEAVDLLRPAGLDVGRVAYARQVHGAGTARAGALGGFAGTADVLVTTEPGVPLAIFTADCLAVTLYDPGAPALVVAHLGWRGTVRGATAATVAALEGAGGRAQEAIATIGPSIGPCCYEVDGPVITELSAAHIGLWQPWVVPAGPGKWMLDLWTANEDLLVRAGVERSRIENPRLCTACNPHLLYSYRKRVLGRLATVAALP